MTRRAQTVIQRLDVAAKSTSDGTLISKVRLAAVVHTLRQLASPNT
jgi:hypothetical protein